MEIVETRIYTLKIPFNYTFGHSLKTHSFSDSIIVELTTDTGLHGYGEGVARPYVTGETVQKSTRHIRKVLLPAVINKTIRDIDTNQNSLDANGIPIVILYFEVIPSGAYSWLRNTHYFLSIFYQ